MDGDVLLHAWGYFPAFVMTLWMTVGLSFLFARAKADAIQRAEVNAEKLRVADQAKGAFMAFLCHEVLLYVITNYHHTLLSNKQWRCMYMLCIDS